MNGSRIVFMGSPEFAEPSLQRLIAAGYPIAGVYTQPDRVAGRGRRLRPPAVKQLALDNGLPVFQPETLRSEAAIEELRALRPDVVIVVAFGQILRPAVLAVPKHGVLNVHASLLPRYRGASPIVSAILDGIDETGVSIMLVDEGMDTGPVLAQTHERIQPVDDAGTLATRLAGLGAELLVETLPRWLAGEMNPEPQDESMATTTRLVRKEDGRLDWNRPAEEIWRRVRAYTPWPGAMTNHDGVQVQILQCWPAGSEAAGAPGDVFPFKDSSAVPAGLPRPAFAVHTGEGTIVPLVLKKAGKKVLTARDFLNGERGLIGSRLGG